MLKPTKHLRVLFAAALIGVLLPIAATAFVNTAQEQRSLTPLQLKIEQQRARLSSADVEDRRDALTQLRSLQHRDASRAALSALNDPAAIVRATAAAAILSLPADESARSLIPLLSDKEEFVRQQVAYALGQAKSTTAVAALVELLTDKQVSVRGAAAVALGDIGDPSALTSLAAVLDPQSGLTSPKKKSKSKREQNPFVLRAAARSLGQIGNRAGLPALIIVLQDEKAEGDVRREAAFALGAIGDQAAIPALRSVEMVSDPYLSQAAHEALRRISRLPPSGDK